jgi:hypothetical protein
MGGEYQNDTGRLIGGKTLLAEPLGRGGSVLCSCSIVFLLFLVGFDLFVARISEWYSK